METKDLIKAELQKLSKDELIDIIAQLVSVYIQSKVFSRLSSANCVQHCVNNIHTNIQPAINNMMQELNLNFQSTKD